MNRHGPSPVQQPPPRAWIKRYGRLLFRWHIAYSAGIGIVERNDFAISRRLAERKARRMLAKLRAERARHERAEVIDG